MAKTPGTREPIPVIVVDDQDNPPFRLYALLVFLGTLIGSLIGAIADFGGAVETFERIRSSGFPELCIAGSDTILGEDLGLAQAWAEDFSSTRDVRVSIAATGSGAGVRRAAEGGCAHVLAMSEAMSSQQQLDLANAGISVQCAAEIGYDVIAFVTDIDNRVPTLQQQDLSNILNGRVRNWSEITRSPGDDRSIYIYARPIDASGTTKHVMTTVARYDSDVFPSPNYLACESNSACLNRTLGTPGSMYWVSTAWMRTQPDAYLRVLPILRGDERPIDPLREDFTLEEYPSALARPLYMYVLSGASIPEANGQLATDFLDYVRSVQGQQILEERAFITYFDRNTEIPIALPEGFLHSSGPRSICLP